MKKLSAATYAQLLHDSTKGLSVSKQRAVVGKWLGLLRRQRALRLLPRIISHLQRLDDAARKQTRIHVTASDAKGLPTIERQLTEMFGRVAIDLTVDSAVRGGLVLRVGDDEIDGSLRTRLRRLHNHLTNA